MSTLAQLEVRISSRLIDSANAIFSLTTIDEALRTAMNEYSHVVPLTMESVIVLPGDGREIALSALTNLWTVTDVWWPYDSLAAEVWPPNQVAGFRVYWDDAQPVLMLNSKTGDQPQLGDELRLWWTKRHSIDGLAGQSITTVFGHHENGLITGALAYTALAQAINMTGTVRLDPIEVETLQKWGNERLQEFRDWLRTIKATSPTHGEPFGPGWTMDKWDTQRR